MFSRADLPPFDLFGFFLSFIFDFGIIVVKEEDEMKIMPKLKMSEWDPLSKGVFRVTSGDKSYLALSKTKAVDWFSKTTLKLCKEKDGYLFFKEPMPASVALFSSEEFASAANPHLSSHEVSLLRKRARNIAEEKYQNMAQFLNPPGPANLNLELTSPAP